MLLLIPTSGLMHLIGPILLIGRPRWRLQYSRSERVRLLVGNSKILRSPKFIESGIQPDPEKKSSKKGRRGAHVVRSAGELALELQDLLLQLRLRFLVLLQPPLQAALLALELRHLPLPLHALEQQVVLMTLRLVLSARDHLQLLLQRFAGRPSGVQLPCEVLIGQLAEDKSGV